MHAYLTHLTKGKLTSSEKVLASIIDSAGCENLGRDLRLECSYDLDI
jgi:hypothetical protein